MSSVVKLRSASSLQTQALGHAFGEVLQDGDFVSLVGDLGAGKTLFAKGIAQTLGCDPDDVSSPTFTLVQQYDGRLTLYHLDIYRLEDPDEELLNIGYEEFFDPQDGVTLVEWGDRAQTLLPDSRFEVHIEKENGSRFINIWAMGQYVERLDGVKTAFSNMEPGMEALDDTP